MEKAKALLVDDSPISLEVMAAALPDTFAVRAVDSGEACLASLAQEVPDIILLDVEMGGMDGYETCRRLRQQHDVPVIFVSAHDTLDERLAGYDAGGDDFIVKPFEAAELGRKAVLLVEKHARTLELSAQQHELQALAEHYRKDLGEAGVLLNFMRHSQNCMDYAELARSLVAVIQAYGVVAHVQVRWGEGSVALTPAGEATPLERSIIEQSLDLGQRFRFASRLVLNYDMVSILALNMPRDDVAARHVEETLVMLAESTEAVAEAVNMRQESAQRAEALQVATIKSLETVEDLRRMYNEQRTETSRLLQELVRTVEDSYLFLGLTDAQEESVSRSIRLGAEAILQLFAMGDQMDLQFEELLDTLGQKPSGGAELW